jgi:hypothetical protein
MSKKCEAFQASGSAQLLQFPNVWRASEIAAVRTPSMATGFADLDRQLPGGGWPGGALTEILYPRHGIGELQLLLPALSRLSRQGRRQIWIAPPHQVYAPALAQARIDLSGVVVVEAVRRRDMLWATEQALRSAACGAVLVWPAAVEDPRPLQYAEVRRLQIAVEASEAAAFIFRPEAESAEASAAALRLALAGAAGARLAVHILKRRGAGLEAALLIDARCAALPDQDHVMAGHPFPPSPARINIAGELLS